MITITGNGNLTRAPELRATNSGKPVTTISVACQQRNRDDQPTYLDLILWEAQAEAAVRYLVKGQAVSFRGRPAVRTFSRNNGDAGAVIEVHGVDLEYGPKSHSTEANEAESDTGAEADSAAAL